MCVLGRASVLGTEMRLAPPCCWAAAGARPPTPAKAHFSFLFFKKRILSEYRDCGDPKNFTRTPSHNTITTLGTELARTGTNQVPWSTWSAVAGQGGTKKEFYEQKRISPLKGLARFASPLALRAWRSPCPARVSPRHLASEESVRLAASEAATRQQHAARFGRIARQCNGTLTGHA